MNLKRARQLYIFAALIGFGHLSGTGCEGSPGSESRSSPDAAPPDSPQADTDDLAPCGGEDTFDLNNCPNAFPDVPCVFRVAGSQSTPGDGRSWESPFAQIQDAVDAAHCAFLATANSCQVWIRQGTYYIHQGCRGDTIRLRRGVEVYGGFAGTEKSLEERDWIQHETVLSGFSGPEKERAVYHVLEGGERAVVDGLIITGGRADGVAPDIDWGFGGGLITFTGMTIRNCTFRDNSSQYFGGAVFHNADNMHFSNCVFEENTSGMGGAIFSSNTNMAISQCTFQKNLAMFGGGGIFIDRGTVAIDHSTFDGNIGQLAAAGAISNYYGHISLSDSEFRNNSSVAIGGGAIGSTGGSLDIERCVFKKNMGLDGGALFCTLTEYLNLINSVFWGNWSIGYGGAILYRESGPLNVVNSTFASNQAGQSGGSLALTFVLSDMQIANSIFWNSRPNEINLLRSQDADIIESHVQGKDTGDPLFQDLDNGDLSLSQGSPCIDAANGDLAPPTDIEGTGRVDDPVTENTGSGFTPYADMGAYEYQPK